MSESPKRYLDPAPEDFTKTLLELQANPIVRHIAGGMHILAGDNAVERMGLEPHPVSGANFYLEVEGAAHMLRLAWLPAPRDGGFDERKKPSPSKEAA